MSGATVALGDVAEFIRGVTYKPADLVENFSEGSVVCMRTANVQATLDDSDILSIPRSFVRSPEKMLREGDLLVSTANSWSLVGKCCWVPALGYPATVGGFIAALRADSAKLDARYLYRWFSSPKTQALARNCGRQTTNISNMDIGRCLALQLPLPPLAEQRRIAAILDKADVLRAKRREAIAKLDQLLQSVFLDMFGDPAVNPMQWPTRKLGEVARVVSGATPRTDTADYWDGNIRWVTPKELSGMPGFYLGDTERKLTESGLASCGASVLPAGSVLFSSRAPIGHTAICGVPMATNQGFKSFVPNPGHLENLYLLFWLRTRRSFLEGLGVGATFKEVSKATISGVEIMVPPLALQASFSAVTKTIMRANERARHHLQRLNVLFDSLTSAVFEGHS